MMIVKLLSKTFGGLAAVRDVSFEIKQGQIKSLIGPNGSGKTTTVNLITRVEKADKGSIVFLGRELTDCQSWSIASLGISRTFQEGRTFNDLSTLENLVIGLHSKNKSGIFDGIFRTSRQRKEERKSIDRAYDVLRWIGIESLADANVRELSLVNRRWVEIARAIVSKPKLLILDEPAAGLDADEIMQLVNLIYRIRDEGVTIFLIEHHLPVVMGISDEVMVLNFGEKIAEGSPREISLSKEVIAAYLGDEESVTT